MSDDSWYVVRNTPRVAGLSAQIPLSRLRFPKKEVDALLSRMGDNEPKFKVEFSVGETVKITDGPFKDSEGKISEVDEEHGKLKVMVPIFGRETAVELDSLQVQKYEGN